MEERGGSLDWQTYKMDRAREHGYPGEGAGAVKVEGFAHEETKPMAPGDAAIRNGNADDDADVVDDEEDEEDVDDEDDEDDDDVDDELEEEDEEEDVEGELQDLPSVSSDSDGFLSGYEESDQEDQDMLEEGDGGVTGGTSTGAATASRPNYATACNWEECPAPRYETTEQLVQHVTREHIGNRKPEYVCHWNGCRRKGELLANRRKLVTHMQTHTGEKRYHCSETGCQRTFSRYDGIVKHKRDVHGIGKLMPPQGSWEVDVVDRAGEDVEPDSMIHDDGRWLGVCYGLTLCRTIFGSGAGRKATANVLSGGRCGRAGRKRHVARRLGEALRDSEAHIPPRAARAAGAV